jgi:hypothetical protein
MDQGVKSQSSPVATAQKYCAQCGTAAYQEARFCQSCGLDMVAASPATSNYTGQLAGFDVDASAMPGTDSMEPAGSAAGMSLGTAWMIYGAGLLVLLGISVIPVGPLYLPIYLVIGFIMTRIVMRGIMEFHPAYNTVANVFSAKIWMFLLWPLSMGILLFKLTINSSM